MTRESLFSFPIPVFTVTDQGLALLPSQPHGRDEETVRDVPGHARLFPCGKSLEYEVRAEKADSWSSKRPESVSSRVEQTQRQSGHSMSQDAVPGLKRQEDARHVCWSLWNPIQMTMKGCGFLKGIRNPR